GREPIVWLNLSYQVHFDFATIHGAPVDVSSIRSTTVKSVTGETVDVPPGQDAWLRGVRVVTRQGKLEVKKISWSVQQVVISGSNVVHTAQQRFVPADQATVPLKLLFYTVDLRVHDAVFGFPTGRAVHLVY